MTPTDFLEHLKLIRKHTLEVEPWFDTPIEHRSDAQALSWKETHLALIDSAIKSLE
jgi:hypothetical protein